MTCPYCRVNGPCYCDAARRQRIPIIEQAFQATRDTVARLEREGDLVGIDREWSVAQHCRKEMAA